MESADTEFEIFEQNAAFAIRKLLSGSVTFEEPRAEIAASAAASNQPKMHQTYFGYLHSLFSNGGEQSDLADAIGRFRDHAIKEVIERTRYSVSAVEGGMMVSSSNRTPVIGNEQFDVFMQQMRGAGSFPLHVKQNISFMMLAAYIQAIAQATTAFQTEYFTRILPIVVKGSSIFEFYNSELWKNSIKEREEYLSDSTQQMETLRERLYELGEQSRGISTALADLQGGVAEQGRILEASGDEMENWKGQMKAAAEEAFKLDIVQKLWSDRAGEAGTAFKWTAAAILFLLIIVPWAAANNLNEVGKLLKALEGFAVPPMGDKPSSTELTAYAITRIVGITVPIALYFWLIRLLVRFAYRSLLLQDDAKARDTMLQTYLRLVEQNGAAPKEDRALVIGALFRPMPGHGQDASDQPNVTEIINLVSPQKS